MKISMHWAKKTSQAKTPTGQEWLLNSWGGSNVSVEDAAEEADRKILRMAERLKLKGSLEAYAYITERGVQEKVIEAFGNVESPYAAITRNRYGALVLNAAHVFFADVDIPVDRQLAANGGMPLPVQSSAGFLGRLFGFGKKVSYEETRATQQQAILQRFADFHSQNPALNMRVYETAAGYRVIIVNKDVAPQSQESRDWLAALESDPLYCTLCEKQDCYRARLTPKPWRLPSYIRADFYPDSPTAEQGYLLEWLEFYNEQSRDFSVCKLIETYGNNSMTDEAQSVLAVHDQYVLGESVKPLA